MNIQIASPLEENSINDFLVKKYIEDYPKSIVINMENEKRSLYKSIYYKIFISKILKTTNNFTIFNRFYKSHTGEKHIRFGITLMNVKYCDEKTKL